MTNWFFAIIIALAVARLCYEAINRRLIAKGYRPVAKQRELESEAALIRGLLTECAICKLGLTDHLLHEIVSVREPDQHTIHRVDRDMRNHAWLGLVAEYSWDPHSDALVYWLVQCPTRGGGTIYRVMSRAGFDENDDIEQGEAIDDATLRQLLILLNRKAPLML
jgi:hypothetical protein